MKPRAAGGIFRVEGTEEADAFDDILRLALMPQEVAAALITQGGPGRQTLAASEGFSSEERARVLVLCEQAMDHPLPANDMLVIARDGAAETGILKVVPLRGTDGEAIGCIAVARSAQMPERVVGRLHDLARLAASRLIQQRLHDDLRRRQLVSELRDRLLAATASAGSVTEAIAAMAGTFMDGTGATLAYVCRLAPDGETLTLVHAAGRGALGEATFLDSLAAMPKTLHTTQAGAALRSGKPSVVRDIGALPLHGRPEVAAARAGGMVAQIILPLEVDGTRYTFALGLPDVPEDFDGFAALLDELMVVPRLTLHRLHDFERAEMFRRAIEVSPDVIIITDTETPEREGVRIVYANRAYEEMNGYPPGGAIGRSPRISRGEGVSLDGHARIQEAMRTGTPVRAVMLRTSATGRKMWMDVNIAPVRDATGWHANWVGIGHDVTELRTAETAQAETAAALEALLAAMPGAVQRLRPAADGTFAVTFSSRSTAALTGFTPEDIAANAHHTHYTAAQFELVRAQLRRALETGEATLETEFPHRDGRTRVFHAAMRACPAADGTPEVIVIWTDVTESRERLGQLAEVNRLATLGEMATGIAHELGQPLAAIMLNAEVASMLLERPAADHAAVVERLDKVAGQAMRAGEIIRVLREFAARPAGGRAAVALMEAVAGTRTLLERALAEVGIGLEVSVEGTAPHVLGDVAGIEQVLVELLKNARDALIDRRIAAPRIRLVVRVDGGRVRVEVGDNAGGIAEEAIGRVFDPFFTTKESEGGTGLGLAIARTAMAAMGGGIAVRNGAAGAVFSLEFIAAA